MSDYSGYIRGRARALGPFTSVYEATAPGGGPGRFALKIFHPPASTQVRRAYDIEGWLLAAERQQVAFKKDGAVLEILAFGRCEDGAYTVTPWQERSLEPMLTTLTPKGDHLRALAEVLLNALEQWNAQSGGSHRKLKASNIFLTKPGPLAGTTAVFTDPWFTYGNKTAGGRINDLTAVGGILAEVVRRRPVTAWPIEEGPEWRALGRAGKSWLAYCNYLLNPQPAAGELTLTEARKRLKKIPADSNPVRTALLIGAAAMILLAGGLLAFARFGNPIYMPDNVQRLAQAVGNQRFPKDIPRPWIDLCRAWDTWLGDVQNNAPRLLKTEALWSGPNDPLKLALADFNANAKNLLPAAVIPEAAGEKRLGVLAEAPPEAVLNRLQLDDTKAAVISANKKVQTLATQLEAWPRWEELHNLEGVLKARAFDRAFAALQPRLPIRRGTTGYKLDTPRTLKFFNDVSLDETGTLLLASTWRKISDLQTHMEAVPDRIQRRMPELILARLADRSSLGDFADSLADPLAEMSKYRNEYIDPAVVPERFQQDSALLKETAEVTPADFPRWEKELVEYSKVPPAEDPRLTPDLDNVAAQLPNKALALEADKPDPEPGNVPTLSKPEFEQEFAATQASVAAFRAREIVRHDLPAIREEKDKAMGTLQLLAKRVEYTIGLLKPEIWLEKVAQPYGQFDGTRQRWAAWYATLNGVTAAELTRDKARFRQLRANARQVREWIDGLEGPTGLGGLAIPELSAASADTGGALKLLEAARREKAAIDIAAAAEWRANATPAVPWSSATAATRAPLEAHHQWLMDLPAFSADLDRLSALLEGGFGWDEGVSETVTRLARHAGVADLTGKPREWNAEAKLLGRLSGSGDRAELIAAAQNGGLSRKLTAWRRLGALTGWPAGPEDLDIDGGVVAALRETLTRDVKDESRRTALTDELTKETRVRWNRTARNSASDVTRLGAVFERMEKYGITEADLEPPAAYDLNLWRFKRSDWSEVDLAPLKARRDAFLEKVRAIPNVPVQPEVADFLKKLSDIELVLNPSRAPTPSPRLAGWTEELIDDGLGLTATWKSGGKIVKLDFAIVQPVNDDSVLPFYLAKRAIAVGDFIDLVDTRPKEAALMMEELPRYTREDTEATPRDRPLGWEPRIDNKGKYVGFELSPYWIVYKTAPVQGLLGDPGDAGTQAGLKRAAEEKPTLRSPLQMIPPKAAEIFAEKLLGARLPTPVEWKAVLKTVAATNQGTFRGPNFQTLFNYLRDWKVAGQVTDWRPSSGVFAPRVPTATGGKQRFVDDGQPAPAPRKDERIWFAPVDEGPVTGQFLNLLGNVSIYLSDGKDSYVAGGSALSPPGIDFTEPQKVEASALAVGAKKQTEGFSDVGIRPAFDAPPGFRERYKLLVLVRQQKFLTW